MTSIEQPAVSPFSRSPATRSHCYANDTTGVTTISFSTDELLEGDRVTMWRQHYARVALNLEIEPALGRAFDACVVSRILPNFHLSIETFSPCRITRSYECMSDCKDDIALLLNRVGDVVVSARGRQISLSDGDAVLTSSKDAFSLERLSHGEALSIRVSRHIISSLPVDIDDAVMRKIPRESHALMLLARYANTLMDENALSVPSVRHVAVKHVHDLMVLALKTNVADAGATKLAGIRAARLRAAKAYIIENSPRRNLTIWAVATKIGLTHRNLQKLFEADGTTFSAFLLK